MNDYENRSYLSAIEVANYLGIKVQEVHALINNKKLKAKVSASGQYRLNINDVDRIATNTLQNNSNLKSKNKSQGSLDFEIDFNKTKQRVISGNSQIMDKIQDNSVHLVITSPPYFNAKMYSKYELKNDLGNIHNIDIWFKEIGKVWREVYRILQPGRKFFLNIMNLPIRINKSFKSLNLVGKSIDLCEKIGFIFKRDIIWHKTNGVRAHFGTYPYPGGILLNNMHEFILEFNKPEDRKIKKYKHLTPEIKEKSKLDKEFWLSIKNSDVWLIKPENSGDGRKHIAPFPLELPYRLIKAYSFIGETIADPFLGSGTSLIAAGLLERNGIGYELNDDYIPIIKERLLEEKNNIFF